MLLSGCEGKCCNREQEENWKRGRKGRAGEGGGKSKSKRGVSAGPEARLDECRSFS